jgi:hypothetical protein
LRTAVQLRSAPPTKGKLGWLEENGRTLPVVKFLTRIWGSIGIRRGAEDSEDDLFGHIMTRNLNANDDTFDSNVVPFRAKVKSGDSGSYGVFALAA